MNTAQHPKLRLLVTIASFGTSGDKYLHRLIEGYQSMPFEVRIVVLSNIEKTLPPGVELRVGLPTKDPWSLPFAHKQVLADGVNEYDLFIYSEDDTPITERNIQAFLRVSESLPKNEIPGFLRYENGPTGLRNYINMHGHYHWDSSSPCKRGPYTFASLTNEHSACYLLTRAQLRRAIDSGGFLVPPYQGKYDLACTASTDPYTRCGFRKLICISNLDDFLVHHLPDKYTGADFSASDQEFDKQVNRLRTIAENGDRPVSLVPTESKLPAAWYSKEYDEPVREEVVGELAKTVKNVLSVGSGSGKTEKWLVKNGLRVTAMPLDPVIAACFEGTEIEVVNGDFPTAIAKLTGRTFDCLFLSNILHLVKDPEETLKQMAELLERGGHILIVTPNMANLKNTFYGLIGRPGFQDLRDYAKGGVHNVSRKSLGKWLRAAGYRIEHLKWLPAPRFQKMSRLSHQWISPMLSPEMIVLAMKVDQQGT